MPQDCPDDDVLAQFVGRALAGHERAAIEEHCEGCESCGALVNHVVEAFAEANRSLPVQSPLAREASRRSTESSS